jgi:hypothetical protein
MLLETLVGFEVTSHKRRFCAYGSDLLTISFGRTSIRSPRLSFALAVLVLIESISKVKNIKLENNFLVEK